MARYCYDLHGNLIKAIDAAGYLSGDSDETRPGTLYHYNRLGWLLETRVPVRQEGSISYQLTQYQYDAAGNLTKEKRYCGEQGEQGSSGPAHTISYSYDKVGRLTKVSDCTGASVEYRYNCMNRRIYEKRRINSHVNQVTNYTYDAAGRLTKQSQTVNQEDSSKKLAITKYQYDKSGNLVWIKLPYGAEIRREYDVADRLVLEEHNEKQSGIKNIMRFSYDAAGNLSVLSDNQGRNTRIAYDWLDREVSRTDADGGIQRSFYNKDGKLQRRIQPKQYEAGGDQGLGASYTYDTWGRLVSTIQADGTAASTNQYDAAGRLVQTLDASGSGVIHTYDLGGRRIQTQTLGKASQKYSYDVWGNITGIRDGNGNHTSYTVDKWGRITKAMRADGTSESYTYDFAGNPTSSIDGEGNKSSYEYNAAGLLAAWIDPMGEIERYDYDAGGRLCQKTSRDGKCIEYGYNMYGAPLYRREKGGGLSEHYRYTSGGQLETAVSEGMCYTYLYDRLGRLAEKQASGKTLLSCDYDWNGNLSKRADLTGKQAEYHYNALDQCTEVYDNGVRLAAYIYYPDGQLETLQNGRDIFTKYTYDTDKNLVCLHTKLGEETLVHNQYGYDQNGNRTKKEQLGGVTNYTYNNRNQLTKVESPAYKEELHYDRAGNRTRKITEGMEEYSTYDARNRLTAYAKGTHITPFTYDQAGNLLQDDKTTYQYDAFQRMTKAETSDGNLQISRYDAEGLRYEMEENGQLVQFLFHGRNVVAETSKEKTTRYIRAHGLLAAERGGAGETLYFNYVRDEMGSITHVTEGTEVQNYYEYDAWGNVTAQEEKVSNRFRFTGEQFDPITQQYYLRARYYNPVIARFTQEDTYHGDGLNLYTYCSNNPVYYVDPTGHGEEQATVMEKNRGDSGSESGNGTKGNVEPPKVNIKPKIKPSNLPDVNAKPRGTRTSISKNADDATRRSLIRENESADTIAKNGYDIEQNPKVEGTTRNPDYRIENEIFDCYSPAGQTSTRNIASTISEKVIKKGQTKRVVLNLDDWKGVTSDVKKQLIEYPIEGLEEVLIVRDGLVLSIYP